MSSPYSVAPLHMCTSRRTEVRTCYPSVVCTSYRTYLNSDVRSRDWLTHVRRYDEKSAVSCFDEFLTVSNVLERFAAHGSSVVVELLCCCAVWSCRVSSCCVKPHTSAAAGASSHFQLCQNGFERVEPRTSHDWSR